MKTNYPANLKGRHLPFFRFKSNTNFLARFAFLYLTILSFSFNVFAQNISINSTGSLPDTSAMLDINSSNKGFLLPRMATAQINAIPLPATGLIVYNTSINSFQVNTGTSSSPAWSTLATNSNGWSTTGNSNSNGSSFLGTTDNSNLNMRTNNTQRMIIDSLGNVGVGVSPGFTTGQNIEKLLVDAGTTNSVNAIVSKGTVNNYQQINIQNLSNGINASSDIVATADNGNETSNYIDLGINGSNNNSGIMGIANDAYLYTMGNNFLIGTGNVSKSLIFMTGGTIQSNNERMRIDGSGNVGIGTTSPLYKLQINASSDPLYLAGLQNGTNTDSVLTVSNGVIKRLQPSALITSSSNAWSLVGNNSTNPSGNFIGTLDNQPLAFKVYNQSSGKIETSITGNTALGYQAGLSNAGIANTSYGSQALKANTGGNNNTAIGASALKANINGIGNVAVGMDALMSDTSNSNTAVGNYSMQNNISGSSNTATGYSSLSNNKTGTGNTANGAAALQSNNQGINNTGIGNGALQFATSANSNTSVGAFSMQFDTSGASNAALGYGALSANTNGTGNTAVGFQSATTNTVGTYNTLIGYQADVSSNNLTNATAIGYNTKVTVSNSVVLGNAANVGIGTSTPGNKLEINSGTGGVSGLRLKMLPQGAVLFMSSTADVTQSNNNLYFDATNYRLSVGAGTSPNSTLQTGGSFAAAITTKTGNYSASVNDHTILCNNTSGSITITLPPVAGCSGRIYVIKKISGAGNNVAVQGNAAIETIDGSTTKILLNQYNTLMIQSDGIGWDILSSL